MNEYRIKGQARQERRGKARFKPQGGVSATIAAQTAPNAGKALAKAMARVRVTVKGGK